MHKRASTEYIMKITHTWLNVSILVKPLKTNRFYYVPAFAKAKKVAYWPDIV